MQIGAVDTTFTFRISAIDNGGNSTYDSQILRNGINFGPEPFIDENDDSVFNVGEKFFDIGLIDATPATLDFPLRNSAPEIGNQALKGSPPTVPHPLQLRENCLTFERYPTV